MPLVKILANYILSTLILYSSLLSMTGEATELVALQWIPDIGSKDGQKRYDTTTDTRYHGRAGQGMAEQSRAEQDRTGHT